MLPPPADAMSDIAAKVVDPPIDVKLDIATTHHQDDPQFQDQCRAN
ncbi:hypothetical protein A2U01_0049260 [Trifolium medium]|uniref:Uncharacterized protein n=1 Tax=Trifolium medium TaxID=97028 RepID=A0A392QWU1_9FABA|nr:hypothetical protein [Trifolium medium]